MYAPSPVPVQPQTDVTHFEVSARYDSLLAAHGFEPHSPEFSRMWTPVLGPAAAALFRSLADLAALAENEPVDILALGASIGVGARKAPRTVRDGLKRLVFHDLVVQRGNRLAVRTHVPPPTRARLDVVPRPWRTLPG